MVTTDVSITIRTTQGKYPFPKNDKRIYDVTGNTTYSMSGVSAQEIKDNTAVVPTAGFFYIKPQFRTEHDGETINIQDIDYTELENLRPDTMRAVIARKNQEKATLNRQVGFDDQMMNLLQWSNKMMSIVENPSQAKVPIAKAFSELENITNAADNLKNRVENLPRFINEQLQKGAIGEVVTETQNIQKEINQVIGKLPDDLQNLTLPLENAKNPLNKLPELVRASMMGGEGTLPDVVPSETEIAEEMDKVIDANVQQIQSYLNNFYNALYETEGAPLKIMSENLKNINQLMSGEGIQVDISELQNELEIMRDDLNSLETTLGQGSDIYKREDGKIVGLDFSDISQELENLPDGFKPMFDELDTNIQDINTALMDRGIKVKELPGFEEWQNLMDNISSISQRSERVSNNIQEMRDATVTRMQEAVTELNRTNQLINTINQDMPDGATIKEISDSIKTMNSRINKAPLLDSQTGRDVVKILASMNESLERLSGEDFVTTMENIEKFTEQTRDYMDKSTSIQSNMLQVLSSVQTDETDVEKSDGWFNDLMDSMGWR